jgi:hypothetical protein
VSKFNVRDTRSSAAGPIVTETVATGTTHEGAPGYARDAKSQLFLLAVSNMVGEQTFYEKADQRDERYEQLVGQVAVEDGDGACSAPTSRGELLGLLDRQVRAGDPEAHQARHRGRGEAGCTTSGACSSTTPTARASASVTSSTWCTRPRTATPGQGDLFQHALDRGTPATTRSRALAMLRARKELMAMPGRRAPQRSRTCPRPRRRHPAGPAGMTWEAWPAGFRGRWTARLGGGDPVDGLHGAAAQPPQLRRGRRVPTTSRSRSRRSSPTPSR